MAADVNGDGYVDLVCANSGYGTLSVFTNDGRGNFSPAGVYEVGWEPRSVVAADVSGNGYVDLVCADVGIFSNGILVNGNTLSVLTNNGSGGFTLDSAPVCNAVASVVAADVNGDGRVDLVSANFDGTLSVFISVPTLTINNSSNDVTVSWPSVWKSWTLQQNVEFDDDELVGQHRHRRRRDEQEPNNYNTLG